MFDRVLDTSLPSVHSYPWHYSQVINTKKVLLVGRGVDILFKWRIHQQLKHTQVFEKLVTWWLRKKLWSTPSWYLLPQTNLRFISCCRNRQSHDEESSYKYKYHFQHINTLTLSKFFSENRLVFSRVFYIYGNLGNVKEKPTRKTYFSCEMKRQALRIYLAKVC